MADSLDTTGTIRSLLEDPDEALRLAISDDRMSFREALESLADLAENARPYTKNTLSDFMATLATRGAMESDSVKKSIYALTRKNGEAVSGMLEANGVPVVTPVRELFASVVEDQVFAMARYYALDLEDEAQRRYIDRFEDSLRCHYPEMPALETRSVPGSVFALVEKALKEDPDDPLSREVAGYIHDPAKAIEYISRHPDSSRQFADQVPSLIKKDLDGLLRGHHPHYNDLEALHRHVVAHVAATAFFARRGLTLEKAVDQMLEPGRVQDAFSQRAEEILRAASVSISDYRERFVRAATDKGYFKPDTPEASVADHFPEPLREHLRYVEGEVHDLGRGGPTFQGMQEAAEHIARSLENGGVREKDLDELAFDLYMQEETSGSVLANLLREKNATSDTEPPWSTLEEKQVFEEQLLGEEGMYWFDSIVRYTPFQDDGEPREPRDIAETAFEGIAEQVLEERSEQANPVEDPPANDSPAP